MDARATLAVCAVIKSILETADKKIAFFMHPYEVPVGAFKALSGSPIIDHAEANVQFEFADMVNRPVKLPYMDDATAVPLWRVLYDILERSGQSGTRDDLPQDEDEYERQRALIVADDDSGVEKFTQAYLQYLQMRDEWLCLKEKRDSKELELRLKPADDPTRPQLEQLISKLSRDVEDCELRLEVEGRRTDIEQAEQTYRSVKARSPHRHWTQWQNMLSAFVDDEGNGRLTVPDSEARYAVTAISPTGIDEAAASWTRVSMVGTAFDQLLATAPPDLAAPLNPSGGPLDLEKIEFEWTTAGILRPWFDRALFESPGWKFDDPARLISDGGTEPTGEFPFIASGIVLVRGVKPTFKGIAPDRQPRPDVRDHRFGHGQPGGGVSVSNVSPFGTRPQSRPWSLWRTRRRVRNPLAVAPPIAVAPERAFAILQDRAFVRRAVMLTRFTDAAIEGGVDAAAAATLPGPPSIIGLICRPLPRCPNPDPTFFS